MLIWKSQALLGPGGHDAGRQLLQELYTEVTGQTMPAIVTAPGGKPCFEEGPWHFSISHTRGHVFCALADCPVGLDAEEADRIVPEKLAKRILSPAEYAQYAAAPDKNTALLTFWVLKEAAAKCTGRGIQYPENQTNFALTDTRVFREAGCLVAIITEDDHAL